MQVKIINKISASAVRKKRVCAYARVSTDSRRQEDSLENQTAAYERLIKGNPDYEFAGVYADQGISGYCENRPQFQKMLERARAGELDLIITKSISRFARNTVTVLKFARELKELGVGIFFEEQNINTLSGDGKHHLAVPRKSIYILFFKKNTDTQFFQFSCRLQNGDGISCKP